MLNNYMKDGAEILSHLFLEKVKPMALLVMILLLAFLFGTNNSLVVAKELGCFDTTWPSELSDLEPDNSLVRGQLQNKFRYVVKKNSEPERRVAAYLYIGTGSLHEDDNERGYAHFLEHLMFNGSTNFPPGSLIDYLQNIGMDFGRDTNAFTSFDRTVYQLILPTATERDLDVGMKVIADYARGALLLDSEVEKERGVIFSEKKERDSAAYRTHVAKTQHLFKGTKYSQRMVIGLDETLNNADHFSIKSFYDTWYRPENMVLVVVGDLDPVSVTEKIKSYFSGLEGTGDPPKCPDFGELENTNLQSFYHFEPEEGHTTVSLETYWNYKVLNDSKNLQREEIQRIIGNLVIRYRLQKLQEQQELPYVNADYHAGAIVGRIGYGSFVAQSEKDKWKQSLRFLIGIYKSVFINGFTLSEVDRAKKEILAELKNNVLTESTLDSRMIGRRIIKHLATNRVFMNAKQEQELYSHIIQNISVDDVQSVFEKIWSHPYKVVSVTGNTQLNENSMDEILSIYSEEMKTKGQPIAFENESPYPYLEIVPPVSGNITKNEIEEIGVTKYIFPNGLILNLKETEYEKNSFRISALFGNGELEEKVAGQAFVAQDVINYSGSNRLSPSTIDTIIAGTSINLSFHIGTSAFSWTGSALSEEIDPLLQLLHTLLLDVGFRKRAYDNVKQSLGLMYEKFDHDIQGAVPLKIQPFLSNYNIHFGLPTIEQTNEITYDILNQWVKEKVVPSDLEISIVGDINKEQFLKTVLHYFGGFKLTGKPEVDPGTVKFPTGEKLTLSVNSSQNKSLVTVAWPARDFWDISETRRLNLLATIFEDRLRKIVREELGVSYSPQVSNFGSKRYNDYGYVIAELTIQAGNEEQVTDAILQISKDLKENGVLDEEVMRMKKPLVTAILESIQKNQYWLYSVLSGSSRHPIQLQWPLTILEDVRNITSDELSALAKKYLILNKAAIVSVSPMTTAE